MVINAIAPQAPHGFRLVSCQDLKFPNDTPVWIINPDGGIRVDYQPTVEVPRGWYRLELQFSPQGIVDAVVNLSSVKGDQFWLRPSALDRNRFAADVRLDSTLKQITLLLTGSGDVRQPYNISLKRMSPFLRLISLTERALYVLRRDRLGFIRSAALAIFGLRRLSTFSVAPAPCRQKGETPYETWIRLFDEDPVGHRAWHERRLTAVVGQPVISCLTYFSSFDALATERLARSVTEQIYSRWQLVVACPSEIVPKLCDALQSRGVDLRSTCFVKISDDVATTLNALIAAATGDFVLQLPSGSELRQHALLELALLLDRCPDAELVYSDSDLLDSDGLRCEPQFKPVWSPHYLAEVDYIGHPAAYRRATVQRLGGWRLESGDAFEHDLKLRLAEKIPASTIIHLAKVLIHLPQSAQLDQRRQYNAVAASNSAMFPRPRYLTANARPLVSLMIPTRDRADLLEKCVRSIRERTQYQPFEILIIDNASKEAATQRLFDSFKNEPRIRILRDDGEFNFSALNNQAAREAKGTVLGLINNDIEVTGGDWLDEMVALAVRPDVGSVGAKLLYPDGRIQHAGLAIGICGLAGHVYRFAGRDASGYMDQLRHIREVSAVTAACLVVRKAVFDEVGGMDEKELEVAFNDVDFCLKVRAAGYLNVWTPHAELIHHESASRGFDFSAAKAQRFLTEVNVMRQRWGQELCDDPYYSPNLTRDREDCSLRVR